MATPAVVVRTGGPLRRPASAALIFVVLNAGATLDCLATLPEELLVGKGAAGVAVTGNSVEESLGWYTRGLAYDCIAQTVSKLV